ncbi:MAG: pyridoxal 5'-phosphate synthase glutaminase subunit PdxT [Candidatus Altiarchaeales archaeon]|nr:pyridoxal 5'-phosphate synthase glutaminase subunit PdxT [Candidatus Altiarchaeales archaeon]MBD3416924.1 pyridoxal 5'-phosphate synthase glutaminase subunit PdxT [Candidatus Altiarchaeales archaeon]
MKLGVLDVQGDVTEHVRSLEAAVGSLGLDADVVAVRTPGSIGSLSALVIPGGESTTVGKLMREYRLDRAVLEVAESIPIFGTCAGMVLLSREGDNLKEGQSLLGLMDALVLRNAYGRQRESFEAELDIPVLGGGVFPGVFIRAPAFERVWGGCECLCEHGGKVVLARQGDILASAFHPELTCDTRLHEYFLEMI